MGLDPSDEPGPRTMERESRHTVAREARDKALSGAATRYDEAFAYVASRMPAGHTLGTDPFTVLMTIRHKGSDVALFKHEEIKDGLHRTELLDRRLRALGIEPVGECEIRLTHKNRDFIAHCPDRLGQPDPEDH